MNKKINSKTFIGCLCALGCEILFGLSYAFTKQAMESTGAFELLGWRFFVAFVVMTMLVIAGTIKINLKDKKLKPLFKLYPNKWTLK